MEKMIRICGLGTRPPDETTLETLQALEGCRVVFSDVADESVFAWLGGYCRRLSRPKSAADVVAAAHKGGPVGLAVWGHPQFSSLLARRVQNEARAAGVPFTVAGAISPIGSAFARSVSFLGGDYGYQGIQGYELSALLAAPGAMTTELPLVVYAEAAAARDWSRLHALLKSSYPAAHELIVYPASGGPERRLAVGSLGEGRDEGAVILVPPAAKTR
ncbi:MAG TPA: SAM-dependent methyltransferase [Elusimicrobiota bacterium]|jgi:hypothetical protein|nr:SAM-dependent methyltransferase [Elusimicrobiota bacterium]